MTKTHLIALVAVLLAVQAAAITPVFAFNYGDQVQSTTNGLNIHSSHTLSSSVIAQANLGDKGTVQGGPYPDSASGYTFYYVAWVTHSAGYSVQNYLQLAASTPAPSISSVSPSSMPPLNANQTLTIYGSNFQSGATLTFVPPEGGTIASNASKLTFNSSSQITYQINNLSDSGSWTVRVNNPDGQSSGTAGFTVTAVVPAPSISSVSPTSYSASASNQTMTINGSNFVSGATLTFVPPEGGTISSNASKLTFVSSSQITYQFNNGSDAGTWTVKVNNPDGQSSATKSFTVTAVTPAPSISSVSPSSMPPLNANQTLTIYGSNFQSGATLTFVPPEGGTIASNASKLTFNSSSQISYQINNLNDSGSWTVRVNNPDGQSSGTAGFTVTAASIPAPSISSVSPSSMPPLNANQTLTIYGNNFQSGATLTFVPPEGGTIASNASKLTFNSSSQISYQINNLNDSGSWTVRVNNPDGQSSGTAGFTVTAASIPAPSISSVSPSSMPPLNANQTLTIYGSNFQSGATLTFVPPEGGTIASNASKLTFNSSSQISYQINNLNDSGYWTVKVNNPDRQSSGTAGFTVTASVVTKPTATTVAASDKTASGATLNSTVNPNGSSTTISFQYGTTTSYSNTTTPVSIGTSSGGYSQTISGLSSNTTYHFRVVATNSGGTTYGNDLTFKTTTSVVTKPTATTVAASDKTASGATLNSTVNPNGSSTTISFQYGTTTSYSNTTTPVSIGTSSGGYSQTISGLSSNTTYHFRVVATNSGGTTYGNDLTFKTSAQSNVPSVGIGRPVPTDTLPAAYCGQNPFFNGFYKSGVLHRYGGSCTAFCWGRAKEKLGGIELPFRGNAQTWYSAAQTLYQTSPNVPQANSIAVWSYGAYGHVAFVEEVIGNNVTLNEANVETYQDTDWGGGYDGLDATKTRSKAAWAARNLGKSGVTKLLGYIYLTHPKTSASINLSSPQSSSDTTPPTIRAFSVTPKSVVLGSPVTISYTVSDTGGSGLNRVVLWRATDVNGDGEPNWPNDPNGYIDIRQLSGKTSDSNSFSDTPSSAGTYWYGIDVNDNNGNWNNENNSETNGVPGDFGPNGKVTVTSPSSK